MVVAAINPSVLAPDAQSNPTTFQIFLLTMLLYNGAELVQKGCLYYFKLAVNTTAYQVAHQTNHAVRVEDTHNEENDHEAYSVEQLTGLQVSC